MQAKWHKKIIMACILLGIVGLSQADSLELWNENKEPIDLATYIRYSGKPVTVGWDPITYPLPVEYEGLVYNFEREETFQLGKTSDTKFVFISPRSGHYIFKVRACSPTEPTKPCSEYATSDENGMVNDQPRGWWVYYHTQPPGEIIIK